MDNDEKEKLRQHLVNGLKNTVATDVHIDFQKVAEVIGFDKAEEMGIYVTRMTETPTNADNPRSAIKTEKLQTKTGVSGFNRLKLLKELENAGTPKDVPSTGQQNISKMPAVNQRTNSASPKNPADPAAGS